MSARRGSTTGGAPAAASDHLGRGSSAASDRPRLIVRGCGSSAGQIVRDVGVGPSAASDRPRFIRTDDRPRPRTVRGVGPSGAAGRPPEGFDDASAAGGPTKGSPRSATRIARSGGLLNRPLDPLVQTQVAIAFVLGAAAATVTPITAVPHVAAKLWTITIDESGTAAPAAPAAPVTPASGVGGEETQSAGCTTFWMWVGKNWVYFNYLGIAGDQGMPAATNCLLSQPKLGIAHKGYDCQPIITYMETAQAKPVWDSAYLEKCGEGFTSPQCDDPVFKAVTPAIFSQTVEDCFQVPADWATQVPSS